MPSERMQRRVDAFLDEADEAASAGAWQQVAEKARAVLAIDPANDDARAFLRMATANGISEDGAASSPLAQGVPELKTDAADTEPADARLLESPESFAGGRYKVLRFLGEGGKKRVFLAHDALLDRDIAFSLIKTEGLDDVGRERIMREARAMGRLTHPNIVAIFDIGEHTAPDGSTQPYLVQELMGGGDVEGLLEEAEGPLPLEQTLDIAIATARGLEFAHAHQVVHRDLKPGNVWLTADGVAKVGDLGLAVTLGQSRLTSHGMMVGTYNYMPPEQALGQDVTPQADLYSLGAMLYELVTGRPPFQGDTPTAVISQHLNTQPVAPSWHTEHCPPELEALILHLLAKTPTDRPSSATAVLEVLEAVDPKARSASHSNSQANPLDRLARGVFVGRQRELDQLRGALDGALQGRGSIVMLVGEPGIGKTRTVQELETYARMRGAGVYWGRTHESSGMPAYWPWIQVGRAWGAQRDVAAIVASGAPQNGELVRLFPELRQVAPEAMRGAPEDDDETSQFQLFDAYAQFMRAQSAQQPWVVVLDDLHWADKPTLQLLRFIARELTNMHALVIGTYRDTDLVRTHPLSEALAELNREGGFQRISLRGLTESEVAAYVSRRAAVEPSAGLVSRIFEETEGNPFFLSEMVNLMTEEGSLTGAADVTLPDGVREALGRRLDRLSEEANELLSIAAIAGREFAYETLTLVEDRDPQHLLELVEEAIRAQVIEETEQAGRYRFTHALMQETLLDELSTTRRVMLHGRVAEALERRWGQRANEFATRLARHFSESSSLTTEHASKAVHYLREAARQAESRAAWGEATRLYESAIQRVELIPDLAIRDEAALHLGAGRSYTLDVDYRPATRHLLTAAEQYRVAGDWRGQAATAAQFGPLWQAMPAERIAAIVTTALDGLGDSDPALRAELLALRALTSQMLGEDTAPDMAEAARLAGGVPRSRALPYLGMVQVMALRGDNFRQTADLGKQVMQQAIEAGMPAIAASAALFAPNALASIPDFPAYEAATEESLRYARDVANDLFTAEALAQQDARYRLLRGDIAAANDLADNLGDRTYQRAALRMSIAGATGDRDAVAQHIPDLRMAGASRMWIQNISGLRAWGFAWLGDHRRVQEEVERFWSLGEEPEDLRPPASSMLLAVADYGADTTPRVSRWLESFDPLFNSQAGWLRRCRARVALDTGRLDEARSEYELALEECTQHDLELEVGRCHQGLAAVAEQLGDHDASLVHLDAAGDIYARVGAGGYLNEVIAKKEILKA